MAYSDPQKQRDYAKEHYRTHRAQYLDRNRRQRRRLKDYIAEQKAKPCMDCGRPYPPYVMDFDHREPSKKEFEIARLFLTHSLKIIDRELAKCDVVCANCHRERTHRQELLRAGVAQR